LKLIIFLFTASIFFGIQKKIELLFKFFARLKNHPIFNHELCYHAKPTCEYCESHHKGGGNFTWREKYSQVYIQQGQAAIHLQSQVSQEVFEKVCECGAAASFQSK